MCEEDQEGRRGEKKDKETETEMWWGYRYDPSILYTYMKNIESKCHILYHERWRYF